MSQQAKKKYFIRNWTQYNKALIQRGSITLWFSEDAIQKWKSTSSTKKKGRPKIYSDEAILCALLMRTVYHLPLRALEGFLLSLIQLLNLELRIPCYTQICRRAQSLEKPLRKLSLKRPKDIVFDSTGLKVFGEGEWKVKKHGKTKRREWRKLHIGMDPKTQEIVIAELTGNGQGCGDGETAKKLLPKLPKSVEQVLGDGAYDGTGFRQGVENIGAKACVPPPRGAIVHDDPKFADRNDAILAIIGLGGDDDAR